MITVRIPTNRFGYVEVQSDRLPESLLDEVKVALKIIDELQLDKRPSTDDSPSYGKSSSAPTEDTVLLKVPFSAADVRTAVKEAGGRWNGDKKAWAVPVSAAKDFPNLERV